MKQQRHCVADLPLYEYLRRRLSERDLPLGLIPLWALLAGASDFLRLSADEYIHDSDQKLADRETVGQSYVEIVGGVTGNKNIKMADMWRIFMYRREPRIRLAGDCNKFIHVSYVRRINYHVVEMVNCIVAQKYTSIHVNVALLTLLQSPAGRILGSLQCMDVYLLYPHTR